MKRPMVQGMVILIGSVLTYFYFNEALWSIGIFITALFSVFLYKKLKWKGAFIFILFWALGPISLYMPAAKHEKIINEAALHEKRAGLYGVIERVSSTSSGKQKADVRIRKIYLANNVFDGNFKARIYLPENKYYEAGTILYAEGTILFPEKQRIPGGYDEYVYLTSQNIKYKVYADKAQDYGKSKGLLSAMGSLNKRIGNIFDTSLSKQESGIIKAMTIGDTEDLNDEISELYKKTGIFHIIVISGFHITLIAFMLYKLLSYIFPLDISAVLSIFAIVLYCMLTGAGVSSVRAVIMTSAFILGRSFYRDADPLTSTAFSASVLVLYNPVFIFNAGFQLSFACVFSIITGTEPINRIIGLILLKIPLGNRLVHYTKARLAIASSIAAFIGSSPILIHHFNYISPYSVLINIILLPFTSLLTVSSFIMALSGMISTGFAEVLSGIVFFILKFYEVVCLFFIELPYSYISIGTKPVFITFLFYICYILFIRLFSEPKLNPKELKALGMAILIFIGSNIIYEIYPRPLSITMLDVGQGDCFIIEGSSDTFLIDGGGWNNIGLGENTGFKVISPYLSHQGIDKIKAAFISHLDADHAYGIIELLYIKEVEFVVLPSTADKESSMYKNLEYAAKGNNTKIIFLSEGEAIFSKDGFQFLILSPAKNAYYKDINDASLVIKLLYEDVSFLFTGDIGFETEEKLIANRNIKCDILKIAHHGSNNSTSEKFIEKTAPKAAIVSVAKRNNFNQPGEDLLNRLAEENITLFSTADRGTVIIKTDGRKIKIETMLN